VDEKFLRYLANFEFNGDIYAVPEGRVITPGAPVVRVYATPIEKALLEDLLRNRLGGVSIVATKAARIDLAGQWEFVDDAIVAKDFKHTTKARGNGILGSGGRRECTRLCRLPERHLSAGPTELPL